MPYMNVAPYSLTAKKGRNLLEKFPQFVKDRGTLYYDQSWEKGLLSRKGMMLGYLNDGSSIFMEYFVTGHLGGQRDDTYTGEIEEGEVEGEIKTFSIGENQAKKLREELEKELGIKTKT